MWDSSEKRSDCKHNGQTDVTNFINPPSFNSPQMSYELIITEKPSQAQKISAALADGKVIKKNEKGVPYYEITHNGKDIVVACAVGHIFSLTEKNKSFNYPSFDIEWVPASKVDKNASHTTKYLNVIKKLAKEADSFTVATDFDVEGEVIGWNVIRFACKQKDARRMKFSTLTKPDLIKSYENKKNTIEWGQAYAGETRHFLDWMYGINISRALITAIRKAGTYKTLSSGRVQGPALKLIVDKEKEIRRFVPTPFWQIPYMGKVNGEQINAMHKEDKFTDEKRAKEAFENTKGRDGTITDIESRQSKSQPPFPFDLTTLQTESYRSLKISPKDTLAVAQELYSAGYISYPRTSSQQLPKELGLKKLLEGLKRHPTYKPLAEKILSQKVIKPNNGKKTDPAHPAIYPTGVIPNLEKLSPREVRLYDLIVRRFLATFADAAIRETNKIIFDVNSEPFVAKGTRTVYQGWYEFYGNHVKLEEETMPEVQKGQVVNYVNAELVKKMTQPPKRFTPASLIKELEKHNLGTKSTRAGIIDTLVQRGYVEGKSLEPTEIGMNTSDTLEHYCPDIVKEDLTRQFEEEMELIREQKTTEEKVLEKAKEALTKILKEFKEKEKEIGNELKKSLIASEDKKNTIGKCPVCKEGTLMIRYSPKTRQRFIGCNRYPDCKAVFSLPGNGKTAKGTDKICEFCGYPMVQVGTGRSTKIVCFNMECPAKKKEEEKDEADPKTVEALSRPCPECGSKLVLRRSVYGEFIGCSNYPKCKYTAKTDGTPNNYGKKKTKKTTKKKTSKKTASRRTKKDSIRIVKE